MRIEDLEVLANLLLSDCKDLLICKSKDYASEGDVLSHFKKSAALADTNFETVWKIFFSKHYIALNNYIDSGISNSGEDLTHRIQDMINYLVLLQALMTEEAEQSQQAIPLARAYCSDQGSDPNQQLSEVAEEEKVERYELPEQYSFQAPARKDH